MSVLTVQEAQVTTVSVEIQTLTISGKQVTLAVFRQLLNEDVVVDGEFVGTPWGTVNYHPDKCGDARSHLHVVWQKGQDLRRASFKCPELPGSIPLKQSTVGTRWLDAAVSEGWTCSLPSSDYRPLTVQFGRSTPAVEITPSAAARSILKWAGCDGMSNSVQHWREELLEQPRPSRGDLEAVIRADLEGFMQEHHQLVARWNDLTALPQLFIAI